MQRKFNYCWRNVSMSITFSYCVFALCTYFFLSWCNLIKNASSSYWKESRALPLSLFKFNGQRFGEWGSHMFVYEGGSRRRRLIEWQWLSMKWIIFVLLGAGASNQLLWWQDRRLSICRLKYLLAKRLKTQHGHFFGFVLQSGAGT